MNHVFYLRTTSSSSGYTFAETPVDIMKNYQGNCPIYPDGDASEYTISPNGKYIAFVAQPTEVATWTDRLHVYLHPVPDTASSSEDEVSLFPQYSILAVHNFLIKQTMLCSLSDPT